MRLILVILGLTAIALGLVHIRRQELAVRYDMQRIETRHAEIRRDLWDRQVEVGHLTTPQAIRYRAEVMALELTRELPEYTQGPITSPDGMERQ
jgi:hypothetical protein